MRKHKLLIIGSNFGRYHLNASIKSKKFKEISIASPNIFIKKIPKNIVKFKNYKTVLDRKDINMIAIATKPKIQNNVLKYLLKKKIYPNFIFLEKPLLQSSIKLIKIFPKKSLFLTNFIFLFSNEWKKFKKITKSNREKSYFEYTWFFKQAFFSNKKSTWKIKPSEGGGIINYYLPHAIFNILSFFKNIELLKINKKKYTNKILTYLEINFLINKKISVLKINSNSNMNVHSFKIINKSKKKNFIILNKSKKWLSGFNIFQNKSKLYNIKNKPNIGDGREEILSNVYSKILSFFSTKNIETNKSLTYKTFELIHKINKKI